MSNVFKQQTKEEFDAEMWEAPEQVKRGETHPLEEVLDEIEDELGDEMIYELFPVEELEETLAQIERGEYYTLEEVEAELAKEFGDVLSSGDVGIRKNKSA